MKKKSIMLTFGFLLVNSISLAVLQPGTPEVVSPSNSSNYRLSGFCNSGGVDVAITFGALSFSAPCNGVTGTYNFVGDVSADTTTNPVQHCVSQPPAAIVCSRSVDNTLAPPSGSFDETPLSVINSENQNTYSVSGLCAPSGAVLSLTIGGVAGVLSGSCLSSNTFGLNGDVSTVPDGSSLTASLTITSGVSNTISTTVDKNTVASFPFPVVTGVSSLLTDADSDSWLEAGDSVIFAVQFSEAVNLTGSVELDVAISSGNKALTYLSGSGSDTLNFSMPILSNDEQCNGLITIRGISLNGGSILGVTSGQQASFSFLESNIQVEKIDAVAPLLTGSLLLDESVTTEFSSPVFSKSNLRGEDNCVSTDLQGSIGTTIGGTEVTSFISLPDIAMNSYQFVDGVDGFSFSLPASGPYHINLRAVDGAGNFASLSSASWLLSPVYTIPNLIIYLDAMEPAAVLDSAGQNSSSGVFNGFVQNFLDSSDSAVVHNFTAVSASQRPGFNGVTDSLLFDRSNDCMNTPNHPEINTAIATQRSFSGVFTFGGNITTRQMIFEEGGSTRGMNLYVQGGVLYCGFWNNTNDGDGTQPFVSRSTTVTSGQTYNITSVFDYTNYSSPAGPNGTFTCYINGAAMGAPASITSRLFAHSGDVSLGCSGDSTLTHTGASSARDYSGVQVKEFMMFNSPPDAADAADLNTFLQSKWGY
jgi:hypothetical protein